MYGGLRTSRPRAPVRDLTPLRPTGAPRQAPHGDVAAGPTRRHHPTASPNLTTPCAPPRPFDQISSGLEGVPPRHPFVLFNLTRQRDTSWVGRGVRLEQARVCYSSRDSTTLGRARAAEPASPAEIESAFAFMDVMSLGGGRRGIVVLWIGGQDYLSCTPTALRRRAREAGRPPFAESSRRCLEST